jgi:hypothetical protein
VAVSAQVVKMGKVFVDRDKNGRNPEDLIHVRPRWPEHRRIGAEYFLA